MSLTSPRTACIVLLFAGAISLSGEVRAESAPDTQVDGPYVLMEKGRKALIADQYAEASELFRQTIIHPEFASANPKLQYFTFVMAARAADATDDNLSAHEFFVAATSYSYADGKVWLRRAHRASDLEKWSDSALALSTVARKWPKELTGTQYQIWLINSTVRELTLQPALRPQRTELLNALYEASFKSELGIEPSGLWLMLVTEALEQQDLVRAREVSRRITDSSTLVSIRIDKRFDDLIAKEPRLTNVRGAAEREAKFLKGVMKKRPKSLDALVRYCEALYTLGKFDEIVSLADGAIAKVNAAANGRPPYEDLDKQLNWLHNSKASALAALGRREESAEVLANWERSGRNRNDKVSQAINLAAAYTWMDRPDDALKVVDGVDWSHDITEYGRMQYQHVRFKAYLQKGMDAEAREIVAWIRDHQADAQTTAQNVLLEAGDIDAAAALLVTRLRDTDKRAEALAEVQIYLETPHSERYKRFDALRESMLSRPDVAAVIAEYGRREKFPIYE